MDFYRSPGTDYISALSVDIRGLGIFYPLTYSNREQLNKS